MGTSEGSVVDDEVRTGEQGGSEEGDDGVDGSGRDENDDVSENADSLQNLQQLLTRRGRDFGIKVIVMPGVRVPV